MYYADKVMNWCAASAMTARCPEHNVQLHEREFDNLKEKFWWGALRQIDEGLLDQGLPVLKEQLSFYGTVRGPICGRALIRKVDGKTVFDAFPWDPLHTFWCVGHGGLEWICYAVKKTATEIKAEWDFEVEESMGSEDDFMVYDYYDKKINTVVADVGEGMILKKPAVHGGKRVPAWIAFPGSAPPIRSSVERSTDTDADYGESVFKAIRGTIEDYNLVMSIVEELVSRSRKGPMSITSPDGRKQLEEHPSETGMIVSLADGDRIDTIPLMEMVRDTGTFLGLITGEIQRGSLPFSAYGEIAFTLSGFAITQLRQGIDTVIEPRLRLIENSYRQIERLFTEQYATGKFAEVTAQGFDENREFFREEIPAEVVEEACTIEIKLVGQLPQDDAAKVAQAQAMRDGPTPLASDRWIWDNVLNIQDTDNMDRLLKEQQGERLTPIAVMWTHMVAAEEQGRDEVARILFGELQEMLLQKQMALQQAGIMPGGPGGGGPGGPPGGPPGGGPPGPPPNGTAGFAPTVLPGPMQGAPRPVPTPQAGPNVPPGQPRPGAQSADRRLSDAGLFGPGG